MVQARKTLKESPSQTAGPYVHIGCMPGFAGIGGVYPDDLGRVMKTGPVQGTEITLTGAVYDATGTPVRDAMLEIWQADAAGLFNAPQETRGTADPNFTGWGRAPTDMKTGTYRFDTVKPGRVPFHDGRLQAPHITVWIVARGINLGLQTRAYFDDEPEANAADPVLSALEHQTRVPTLMARAGEAGTYTFDIRLRGADETVFFDI